MAFRDDAMKLKPIRNYICAVPLGPQYGAFALEVAATIVTIIEMNGWFSVISVAMNRSDLPNAFSDRFSAPAAIRRSWKKKPQRVDNAADEGSRHRHLGSGLPRCSA
ncbi:hypothetical protein MMC10_002429 [Thelotrema lepadinum]|nr:hypothetical protein [Thelotrema lepadinum]